MPKYRITSPDGVKYEITAPDGATQDEVLAYAQSQHKPTQQPQAEEPSLMQKAMSGIGGYFADKANIGAGAIRGAGSIGATALAPIDYGMDYLKGDRGNSIKGLVSGNQPISRNEERRQAMTSGLGNLGFDTKSDSFAGGKLAAEIAGTADVGGVLGAGAEALKMQKLANALRSSGFSTGAKPAADKLSLEALENAATRIAGGAGTGAASAGMIDPKTAGTGAVIGGSLPVVAKIAGEVGSKINSGLDDASHSLMQSALKPTLKQRESGQADRAIQTLLDEGLNATKGGVEQLQSRVGGLNDDIKNVIANSDKTIEKQAVIDALRDTKGKFSNQVSPTNDLNAIDNIANDFKNHPAILGSAIPVSQAQDMKQGTYKVLSGKYGETGSAATEAQKALARGLKEQIALAHPEISAMNQRESDLINALGVTERRALLDENKNPIGLAALASNPIAAAGMLADRSALVKSLLARGSNKLSKASSKNADLAKLLIEQATPKLVGVSSQ